MLFVFHPPTCTPGKSLAASSQWPPHRCWKAAIAFTEATSLPNSLSLSSENKSSSPMTVMVIPGWTHSSLLKVLYWQAQNWTQCSGCGLMSAEWRGIIFSLNLLAVLLLMKLRIYLVIFADRAHCCLMSHLLPTGPQILFRRAASQPTSSQTVLLRGTVPSQSLDLWRCCKPAL